MLKATDLRRHVRANVWALLATVSLIVTMGVAGQRDQKTQQDYVDRLGDSVTSKEPGFTLVTKHKRTSQDESALLGWKSGDDIVSATTYECASSRDAEVKLKANISSPLAVTVETVELRDFGDEAYIRSDVMYSPKGMTYLFFRRRKILVVMTATSKELGLRFAREILEEIDKL